MPDDVAAWSACGLLREMSTRAPGALAEGTTTEAAPMIEKWNNRIRDAREDLARGVKGPYQVPCELCGRGHAIGRHFCTERKVWMCAECLRRYLEIRRDHSRR